MAQVRRLKTFVEVDEGSRPANSVRARLDGVLDDGTRVTLLDDRGWTGGRIEDWNIEEIEQTARAVVGPDEPLLSRGETAAQMTDRHRQALRRALSEAGFDVVEFDFEALPHDVVFGARLSRRLGR